MGCGASTVAPEPPNPTADASGKKARTRRASVEVMIDTTSTTQTGSNGKKGRVRRSSVEQLRIDAPTGGGNEEEDEYTPASESRIQSRGTASAVDRHARRRASVEAEQAALMAAAAAAAGSADGDVKKKKKKKRSKDSDYVVPTAGSRFAVEFEKTKLSDLKRHATLGVGTFSRVNLVEHKRTGKTYALKRMEKRTIEQLKQKTHIMNEKRILEEMDHPFIIQLHATYKDKACLYMVTELVLGGELFSVLTREEYLDEQMTQFYCGCVVLGMEALHAKDNIYRDLKPENILLDTDGYVKICDFGFAKKVAGSDHTHTTCGTPEYVSPEMLANTGHGKPTDWWCVGILIYECLFATTPFAAEDYPETYEMINRYAAGKDSIDYACDGVRISKPARTLMQGLLHPQPNQRLGPAAVKKHAWFQKMDWDKLAAKQVQAPWVPPVKDEKDTTQFEGEDYGEDKPVKAYNGDGHWFEEF